MKEPVEYFINFDISKLDKIGKMILKEEWLVPLQDKLKLLCISSQNRFDFNYRINEDKLTMSVKAPEKSIDELVKKLIKRGTDIIKGLTKNTKKNRR